MVGTGNYEVDRSAVGEEVVQAQLRATRWRAVGDDDPVIVCARRIIVRPCPVLAEGVGIDVGGFDWCFDDMRFADP